VTHDLPRCGVTSSQARPLGVEVVSRSGVEAFWGKFG